MGKIYHIKTGYLEPALPNSVSAPKTATVIKVFGGIGMVFGIIAGFLICAGSIIVGITVIAGALLSGSLLYGFGQIIELLHYGNEKYYTLENIVVEELPEGYQVQGNNINQGGAMLQGTLPVPGSDAINAWNAMQNNNGNMVSGNNGRS